MNVILEIFWLLVETIYYYVEAMVKFVLPPKWRFKDISGKTVLITGAGSGLGRLMSLEFAKRGCRLVLWDIDNSGNQTTSEIVQRQFPRVPGVHTYTVDLSKRENVYAVADKVKEEVGDIDILVNNAGIVTGKPFMECSDSMMQRTMDVNATAHFWTVKSFLPSMLEKNRGHIVTVASLAGKHGLPGLVDYCTSKYAAVGFDESLRYELYAMGKTGVKTSVVCPFLITTGMFDGADTGRFSFLFPMLEPEYTVDRIMEGVLTNQQVIIIPPHMFGISLLRQLMPVRLQTRLADFLGYFHYMDTFKGRKKSD